jgi:adenine-specific DNA-methyltransferase
MPKRPRLFSPPEFEPAMPLAERKSHGVYYTPPEIAEQIVEWTLVPLIEKQRAVKSNLRTLDPSCGAGEFLMAAYRRLAATVGEEAARSALWGIDIDASAVAVARKRLKALDPAFPMEQIIVADALHRSAVPAGSFDAVVGNPPYINIRQLSKTQSREQMDALRATYATALGNFDLYVLFIERAMELLKPGGRCGLIIPGQWATLDYARACRELLLAETTIEKVINLSDSRAFANASVYPHVVVYQKRVASAVHVVQVGGATGEPPALVPQAGLNANAFQFLATLDVESRIETAKLGDLAMIRCGTAGYAAQKIASRIVDQPPGASENGSNQLDFVTSGNIDRYRIQTGNVRYLNRHYVRPKLEMTAPELTADKRRLFASRKIVIAGMSRRLEAAWDQTGLALGVQVFAVSDWQVDPYYLLAVLNSKLLSYLFATRFAAKRLGGGYLAINKGQLAQLPIRLVCGQNLAEQQQAEQLGQLGRNWSPHDDPLIDRLVYRLYHLSASEIERIEAHFAQLVMRAA